MCKSSVRNDAPVVSTYMTRHYFDFLGLSEKPLVLRLLSTTYEHVWFSQVGLTIIWVKYFYYVQIVRDAEKKILETSLFEKCNGRVIFIFYVRFRSLTADRRSVRKFWQFIEKFEYSFKFYFINFPERMRL